MTHIDVSIGFIMKPSATIDYLGNVPTYIPNKKSFSLVSVVFCAACIVYVIQYNETDIHSVRRILSEEMFFSTEEPPETPTNSCTPRNNIVFLKTHKCASSSIQNIFNRYGFRKKLTFVLPAKGSYIGHPEPFNWSMVPDVKRFGLRYNILTHHCRLNYDEMRKNLPDDVLFITIVRNPVELYESLFSFYSLHRFYKERFDTLGKHQKPAGFYEKRMGGKIGFNQMLFDLGMDDKGFANSSAVMDYVYFLTPSSIWLWSGRGWTNLWCFCDICCVGTSTMSSYFI
ncbi:galactosylceramide sulfotransferase [Caerostris extrusa]|uniref:Galactosylceramide sulfotransferase n=1 Tax=Caerostris extrusa TaxID=172846 RepID=A0AAV4WHZ1_CAEEX|nr:galactosylceramide sulfotransferase [Caerostris extrusa]